MQNLVPPRIAKISGLNDELALKDLRLLAKHEYYHTIRSWLGRQRGSTRQLEMKHIEAVTRLISSGKSGRSAELPGGGKVVKSGGKLHYVQNKVEN